MLSCGNGKDVPFFKLKPYYERAIRKAEQRKIYLALENEAHDITQSPEGMKAFVEYMDSEYFQTNFDATNYYQAGYEGFPYAYEVLKEHIVHVHIKTAVSIILNSDMKNSAGEGK